MNLQVPYITPIEERSLNKLAGSSDELASNRVGVIRMSVNGMGTPETPSRCQTESRPHPHQPHLHTRRCASPRGHATRHRAPAYTVGAALGTVHLSYQVWAAGSCPWVPFHQCLRLLIIYTIWGLHINGWQANSASKKYDDNSCKLCDNESLVHLYHGHHIRGET